MRKTEYNAQPWGLVDLIYAKNRTQSAAAALNMRPMRRSPQHCREILQEVQEYCSIEAAEAEILHEMQQIQRLVALSTRIPANDATMYP
ncbi:hypothetical protein BK146_18305 [Paenibacillus sp. FSL R7-0333]|nr:hypothetical protein BK146_18305 [Paenibacillus sp. FSL R7-0333]